MVAGRLCGDGRRRVGMELRPAAYLKEGNWTVRDRI